MVRLARERKVLKIQSPKFIWELISSWSSDFVVYAMKEVVNGIFDSVSHLLLEPVRQELSFGEVNFCTRVKDKWPESLPGTSSILLMWMYFSQFV